MDFMDYMDLIFMDTSPYYPFSSERPWKFKDKNGTQAIL